MPRSPQPYTEDYRKLRNAEAGQSLPQVRAHQLVIPYQMASTENIETCNIIET